MLVNCKFKSNKNLNLNLNQSNLLSTLYREIPKNFIISILTSWLKSPKHSGFPLPFNSAFRVSSSTERAVISRVLIELEGCKKPWVAPTGVVKNNGSHPVFRTMGRYKASKARQNRIWCFGKLKMFLLYPSTTFRKVQEGGELVQENPPGTILIFLRSTPR